MLLIRITKGINHILFT